MRKVSRRGILAGLLATSAAPAAAMETPPDLPRATFCKGQIMPRTVLTPDLTRQWGNGFYPAVAIIEYDIYDGDNFIPLNSIAGQRVVAELS